MVEGVVDGVVDGRVVVGFVVGGCVVVGGRVVEGRVVGGSVTGGVVGTVDSVVGGSVSGGAVTDGVVSGDSAGASMPLGRVGAAEVGRGSSSPSARASLVGSAREVALLSVPAPARATGASGSGSVESIRLTGIGFSDSVTDRSGPTSATAIAPAMIVAARIVSSDCC
jgi:hypothetical protein